jgi:hypothetical protein
VSPRVGQSSIAKCLLCVLLTTVLSCAVISNRLRKEPAVLSFLDFPVFRLYTETDKHVGKVFEDRFRFYRIYYQKPSSDLPKTEPALQEKIEFMARPTLHPMYAVRIQVTPQHEQQLSRMDNKKRKAVCALVRFVGKSPDGTLEFDLLEIFDDSEEAPAL